MPEDNEGLIERENRELRKIIAELGYCTPGASLEFMQLIPAEIRAARAAALRTAAPQVNEALVERDLLRCTIRNAMAKPGFHLLSFDTKLNRIMDAIDERTAPPAAPQDYCGIEQGNEEEAGQHD